MTNFEWDNEKDTANQRKHNVSFEHAQYAFADPKRVVALDDSHSTPEEARYFCIGKVEGKIVTVRFTYREGNIRIFGAGYWRKEKKLYEKNNKVH